MAEGRTWQTPFERAVAEGRVRLGSPFPGRDPPRPSGGHTIKVEQLSQSLAVGERGAVLAAPVIIHDDGRFSTTSYDRHHLQAALLFWDALDYPSNSGIEIGDSDLEALVALGAINRTRVSVSGQINLDIISAAHVAAFDALDAASPGRWSLARFPDGKSFPASDLVEKGGLSVTLANAIPLPGREVPFEDLLEFRMKRKSELLALRAHFDQLSQTISSSPDTERALVAAIDELDRAVRDQLRVTRERFGIASLIDLKAGFNVADAVRHAGPTFAALLAGGLPLTSAALYSLAAGTVTAGISVEIGPGRRKSERDIPFEYVVQINREFG